MVYNQTKKGNNMGNKIYLVRHAQSEANVNFRILRTKTNMSANITDIGHVQAKETGIYLNSVLNKNADIKIWNSPYQRTRQTAQIIKDNLKDFRYEEEESLYIGERQFGVLDSAENYSHEYKEEVKHYLMHKKEKHDFFVRPSLGESPYDMCLRLDAFINFYLKTTTNTQHVLVLHGAAIKGFLMMWLKKNYEWYNEQNNSHNAAIHYIDEHNKYHGEIFTPSDITG